MTGGLPESICLVLETIAIASLLRKNALSEDKTSLVFLGCQIDLRLIFAIYV
jgi:hypothetical protein